MDQDESEKVERKVKRIEICHVHVPVIHDEGAHYALQTCNNKRKILKIL